MSKDRSAVLRRKLPGALLVALGIVLAMAYGLFSAKLPFGPPLVILGLGGMTLALAAMALFRVLDPLLRGGPTSVEVPQARVHLRELERDKQAVLKSIREIELDYQMRKISEPDYRDMLQRYRARAMRIIRELDAGDDYRVLIEDELKARLQANKGAPVATSEAPTVPDEPPRKALANGKSGPSAAVAKDTTCPSCGTANDVDAVFCKKCGGKIAREIN